MGLWGAKESIHPLCSPFCRPRDQPLAHCQRGLAFKSPMSWVCPSGCERELPELHRLPQGEASIPKGAAIPSHPTQGAEMEFVPLLMPSSGSFLSPKTAAAGSTGMV